jgi:hypothetical protein
MAQVDLFSTSCKFIPPVPAVHHALSYHVSPNPLHVRSLYQYLPPDQIKQLERRHHKPGPEH